METSAGNGIVSLGSSPETGGATMNQVGVLLSQLGASDDSFACDICFEALWAPIPMCTTGHSICKRCRDRSENCPVCRKAFSEARNFKLERIIAERHFSCPFLSRGCELSANGAEMKDHIKICKFAPIQCHFANKTDECQGKMYGIRSTEYLQHLINVHKFSERDMTKLWVEKYRVMKHMFAHRNDWPFTFAKSHDNLFISRIFSRDSNLYFSVAVMAEAEEASLFTANVLLKSPGENETPEDHFGEDHKSCSRNVMSFTFPVHSIRLKDKKVIKSGCFAVCPVSYIYDFFSTDQDATEGGRHFWAKFQISRRT